MLAGCEASLGTPSDKEQLERIISEQLPPKLKAEVKSPKVASVKCVEGPPKKFKCSTKVTYVEKARTKKVEIPISGKCDEETCSWETTN